MQHKKSLTSEWKCDHHPDQVGKREIAPNDITSVNGVSAAYNQTLYEEMTAVQLNRDAGVPGGGGAEGKNGVWGRLQRVISKIEYIYRHTFIVAGNGDAEQRGCNLSSCLMNCFNFVIIVSIWCSKGAISLSLSTAHLTCVGACYETIQTIKKKK